MCTRVPSQYHKSKIASTTNAITLILIIMCNSTRLCEFACTPVKLRSMSLESNLVKSWIASVSRCADAEKIKKLCKTQWHISWSLFTTLLSACCKRDRKENVPTQSCCTEENAQPWQSEQPWLNVSLSRFSYKTNDTVSIYLSPPFFLRYRNCGCKCTFYTVYTYIYTNFTILRKSFI